MSNSLLIGVISDTHGLLRPEALRALEGSDAILHAGDVGEPAILTALGKIAPVHAVRGNVDTEAWAEGLSEQLTIRLGKWRVTIVHKLSDAFPLVKNSDVVVYGHSHQPGFKTEGDVLYFNPGSAGPRRFRLPVTCGRLLLKKDSIEPEILQLMRS